jgi:hypothetical protein
MNNGNWLYLEDPNIYTDDEYYNFHDQSHTSKNSDVKSIIHAINMLGADLVGVECGVFEATSFVTILANCNIKTLYGVDPYLPYQDYLRLDDIDNPYVGPDDPDSEPVMGMTEKAIELVRAVAVNKIKWSGHADKVVFYEEKSSKASKRFEDETLDFVFVDSHTTYNTTYDHMEDWYCKVKSGGLFIGHDYHHIQVKDAVRDFRKDCAIISPISIFDDCFCWKKP